jgi:2,4-dienoyl-CoA reductase (NADPH2)
MVVGAGPAGLQAAIAAARRGHHVTVYEREARAGGQVAVAASVPNRAELGDLVRNQLIEAARFGVTIVHGIAVTAQTVASLAPERIIVATGAEPARPWWAPADATWIVDCRDVLAGTAPGGGPRAGERVVIVDEIGFHHATSTADALADRGCLVEVVTNGMVVGQDLGITLDMETWWMRADAKSITQSTDLVPMGASDRDGQHVLELLHHPTGQMQPRTIDWVVLAVPPRPVDGLYHELRAQGWSVERIGDAVAPRRAHAAVIDGERVGSGLA